MASAHLHTLGQSLPEFANGRSASELSTCTGPEVEHFHMQGSEADDNPARALKEELRRLHSRQREEIVGCIENWLMELGSVARLPAVTHELAQKDSWLANLEDLQPPMSMDMEPTDTVHGPMETSPSHAGTTFENRLCEVLPGVVSESEGVLQLSTLGPSAQQATSAGGSSSPTKRKKKRKATNALMSKKRKEAVAEMTKLQQFTSSTAYEYLSGTLIVLNAVYIGVQTQVMAQQADDRAKRGLPLIEDEFAWMIGSWSFCVIFIMELGLRWVGDGVVDFFKTQDWGWNLFDVIIVTLSFVDLVMQVVAASSPETDHNNNIDGISVLRVLRVVRIVRVARVIRVMRFFRELRMMIFSILGSMKSLLWVLLVLVLTFYMFGMSFTNAVLGQLNDSADWRHAANKDLIQHFGTLNRSMISLFMAMSGGNDWGMYFDTVNQLGNVYSFLFLLFITFSIFAVTNIVTGVFVETALQSNGCDRDVIVHEELENKRVYTQAMKSVFEELDDDGTGQISLEEFVAHLDDERVIAYFNALKLDVSDASTLFKLLDSDQSNEISIDEFLSGCFKLQGESRSLDLKMMQYEMRFLREAFAAFTMRLDHSARSSRPHPQPIQLSASRVNKAVEVQVEDM